MRRSSISNSSSNNKKARAYGIPTIDLSDSNKSRISHQIVKACEEVGIFKVVNHGVPDKIVAMMEMEALDFFAKPNEEKICVAGRASPFGYGCNSIGFNGDKGELEYILLEASNLEFGCVVKDYVETVRDVACEVLELAAEGLSLGGDDRRVFSSLLKDPKNDSCFRINHYSNNNKEDNVGFGEHSDPQILTVLRSNDGAGGLQICSRDGLWIPVASDPKQLFMLVGDAFEALTNGRFKSVRHRVIRGGGGGSLSSKPRTSMMYFGTPPLNAWLSPLPQLLSVDSPARYKPFTWREYKQAVYSLRLAHNRLALFKNNDLFAN